MTLLPIAAGMTVAAQQRVTPNNGDTITINSVDGVLDLILAPTADISTLTLVWPTVPYAGSRVNIVSTANIASITHAGNTLNLVFSSIKAAGSCSYAWDAAGSTYMCAEANAMPSSTLKAFSATVAGGAGNAVCYATSDGTSGGTALFKSIDFMFAICNPNTPINACGIPTSSDGKTITTAVSQQTFDGVSVIGINVIGSVVVGAAPNGTAITVFVHGVLA